MASELWCTSEGKLVHLPARGAGASERLALAWPACGTLHERAFHTMLKPTEAAGPCSLLHRRRRGLPSGLPHEAIPHAQTTPPDYVAVWWNGARKAACRHFAGSLLLCQCCSAAEAMSLSCPANQICSILREPCSMAGKPWFVEATTVCFWMMCSPEDETALKRV